MENEVLTTQISDFITKLAQANRQIVRKELEGFFKENRINVQQEEPTTKVVDLNGLLEARPILGSRSTIYKKVYKGLIPHSKRGKKLFFDLKKIDAWLLANSTKTTEEIEAETKSYLPNKKRR